MTANQYEILYSWIIASVLFWLFKWWKIGIRLPTLNTYTEAELIRLNVSAAIVADILALYFLLKFV